MTDQKPPTREAIHKIAFDDAMHCLKVGAPGLSDESRRAIAIGIAVRVSHHLTTVEWVDDQKVAG